MPFSARQGFFSGVVSVTKQWYEVSNTEILADIATWNRTTAYATANTAVSLSGIYTSSQAFLGGTLHTNGNIYYPPFTSSSGNILCFNPAANTVTSIPTGLSITGTYKHYSGILARDGKIYFPPINAGKILIIDPNNNNACSQQTWGLTLGNYDCSVYAHDLNKIYCIGSATHCLIVDLTANTATQSNFSGIISGTTQNRYVAGTYALKKQRVVFAPYNSTHFLLIDPVTDTAQAQGFGLAISAGACQGCTNGKDGNVWATATSTTGGGRTYTVDLAANTAIIASSQSISSGGGAGMGSDGNVWVGCFPGGQTGFANVDTKVVQVNPTFMGTSSRTNPVLALDGLVYAITQDVNGPVIRHYPQGSGASSPILKEIALSGYFNHR